MTSSAIRTQAERPELISVSTWLPRDLVADLDRLAAGAERSRGGEVRIAVRGYIEQERRERR
jgi:metal-responsive CopG/Arc/MetJ family transcriptional regulator